MPKGSEPGLVHVAVVSDCTEAGAVVGVADPSWKMQLSPVVGREFRFTPVMVTAEAPPRKLVAGDTLEIVEHVTGLFEHVVVAVLSTHVDEAVHQLHRDPAEKQPEQEEN